MYITFKTDITFEIVNHHGRKVKVTVAWDNNTLVLLGVLVWGKGDIEVRVARTALETIPFLDPTHICCYFSKI